MAEPGSSGLVERLAVVACDVWFEASEEPTRWATASLEQRATFLTCATFAVRAAREGRRSEREMAQAICHGFWLEARRPRGWESLGRQQQEMFVIVARAVIAAGKALRAVAAVQQTSQREVAHA